MNTPNDLVITLHEDYCLYWGATSSVRERRQTIPLKPPRLDEARRVLFQEMIGWCRKHGLEPRSWLFWLFRARRWLFPVKLLSGHLMTRNPKMHRAYFAQTMLLYPRGRRARDDTFDPNRDLSFAVEQYKATLQRSGSTALCMAAMVDCTFGFHPRSEVCGRCSHRDPCRARLQRLCDFDVMALRLGEITAVQARAEALRHG